MDTIERILIYFLAVFYILLFLLNHNDFHPNVARSRQASVVSPSDSKKSDDGSKKSNVGSKKSTRSRKAKDAGESGKAI